MTETPEQGEIDMLTRSRVAGPVTRDLSRREADGLLRSYLEPAGFSEGVRRLAACRLLVLVGEEGTGRRLGAVALLSRMSLAEGRITVLSPAATAHELLTGTEYEPGRAYLLHDWVTVSTDRTALVDLARKLAELGSYLVITRDGGPSAAVEVEHPWVAPEPGELFDLCLSTFDRRDGVSAEDVARARDIAHLLATPAEVVRLAARVARGEEAEGEEVAAWFDTKPPLREVLAVAAPAFAHRLPAPAFDRQLARLERLCGETGERPPSCPLVGSRDGLVAFLAPHQRAQVLAELVVRYGFWLWQPLRDWALSLPGEGPAVRASAAEAVALLAAHSFAEVRHTFLEVWARGNAAERAAAAGVLSSMCADDALAPKALGIALAWADGPEDVRVTAAAALGGALAARYPGDAVRHLRRLETGHGPAAVVAARSLALSRA
ncbi:hypothetical protein ACIBP6_45160 [Nonomuraea terrae]|uniref:hypothetical protein n=1 Tax=Nonomuraea terrae TaxID=2530383 RepID=UPI0037A38EA6